MGKRAWDVMFSSMYGLKRRLRMADDLTPTPEEEPKVDEPETLTLTQRELDSLVDKRTSKALETAKGKWQEKWEAETQAKVSKAEELAKMNAAERKAAEDKAKLDALNKREQELNMREYRYEAKAQLEEQGLPEKFVDMVLSDDAETTKNNITSLKAEFDKSIEAAVNERLKGSTPSAGGKTDTKSDMSSALGL